MNDRAATTSRPAPESALVGFCKECFGPARKSDEIAGHPGIYDCPNCGHPNGTDDLMEPASPEPVPPGATDW